MIRKTQITFDGHAQVGGSMEVVFVGEELLSEKGPLNLVNSLFFRLPFRLRLGARLAVQVNGVIPARIVVLNSADIPNPQSQRDLLGTMWKVRPEMASDVLVTVRSIELNDGQKAAIMTALSDRDYSKTSLGLEYLHIHPEDILKPLNSLVVSYRVLFGEEVRGNRVRRLHRRDVGDHTYSVHVFLPAGDPDDPSKIEASLLGAKPRSATPLVAGGDLFDLPAEGIAKFQKGLAQNTQYAFYSLAIQSQDYIQQTDYLNALLYAVIALENAHAELLEHVAEARVGCPEARGWAQELLRQAGISAIVRLTPYLFMEPRNRPAQATIDDVVKAIQIRNELAHAKRDRAHNLKVDTHSSRDLLPLIEAVFAYTNCVARQLPE
jgi:hypothetical protein